MKDVRIALALCLLMIPAAFTSAGDSAVFVNLGFSSRGDYFMFAQYGVAATPYAETLIVDVAKNNFVKNGTVRRSFPVSLLPGQEPEGGLFTLIEQQAPLIGRYRIDHFRQGRLLYLLMNGDAPKDTLEFRDFPADASYKITLNKKVSGSGLDVKSSFTIDVSRTGKDGTVSSRVAGNPKVVREGVRDYRIRRIIAGPDERSLVFVIEKELAETDGVSIRYMVETMPF